MLENQLIKHKSRGQKDRIATDPTAWSKSEKCDYGEYTFAPSKKTLKIKYQSRFAKYYTRAVAIIGFSRCG
jgi:hypothetical protein